MLLELPTCQPSRKSLQAHMPAIDNQAGKGQQRWQTGVPNPNPILLPETSLQLLRQPSHLFHVFYQYKVTKPSVCGVSENLPLFPPPIFKTCFTLEHHLLEHRLQGTTRLTAHFREMGGEEGRLQCLSPVQSVFV